MREPVAPLGATVTAAGRYGYPGFLLGLATNQVSLSYWDYQLRIDGGKPANGWTVFLFGARDELDTPAPTAMPNDPNPPLQPSLDPRLSPRWICAFTSRRDGFERRTAPCSATTAR